MKAIEGKDDETINLNVSGQKLTTKRSTLCQVEGSLLVTMLNGRWEGGIECIRKNNEFFDDDSRFIRPVRCA